MHNQRLAEPAGQEDGRPLMTKHETSFPDILNVPGTQGQVQFHRFGACGTSRHDASGASGGVQAGQSGRPRKGARTVAGRRQRLEMRRADFLAAGPADYSPPRFCPERGVRRRPRTALHPHRRHRRRRLWPWHAGAGLRYRSSLPAAGEESRLGRARHRVHALYPVGSRLQGRPCHAYHRGVHPAVAQRHDHPHGDPRNPLYLRLEGTDRGAGNPLRQRNRQEYRPRLHRRQACRARRAAPQGGRHTLPGRAERQGRARAACATFTRCSGSPNISTG